jgi:quercetin dioxygenase-like cupin family protein
MKIYHPEELTVIKNPTPGVRHRLNILTEEQNAKALAGHFSLIPPGKDVPCHYHEKRESLIFLIAGELIEIVEGNEFSVKAGDVIFIAAGEKHKTENRSDRDARYIEFFTPTVTDFITVA